MADLSLKANHSLRYYALGEQAITVVFADHIDPDISHKIRQAEIVLSKHPFSGMLTTVAAYTTLSIYYDPFILKSRQTIDVNDIQEWIFDYFISLMDRVNENAQAAANILSIPVCYGGEYGPDLDIVSAHTGLNSEEVIAQHTSQTYLVYMMGFMPGFPYLGGLRPSLATPRKATPRNLVTQGSVGIAGEQTGVYPLDSPGGWQLIGRTPLRLFDPKSEKPILLQSGQQVRFERLEHSLFDTYQNDHYGNKTS